MNFARCKGLVSALLEAPNIMGFCYTQLYDVEQEVNGLYTYDREDKFDDYSEIIAANRKKRLLRNSAGTVAAAAKAPGNGGLGRPQGRRRPAGAAEGPAAAKKAAALYGGIGGKRLRAEMRGDGGTPARPQAGRGRRGRSHGARRAQKSIVSPSAGFS